MREVFPLTILRIDGVDLPLTQPLLHRLFALNGELNVFKILPPRQSCDVIARSEFLLLFFLVLDNASVEIARDTDVERAVQECEPNRCAALGAWLNLCNSQNHCHPRTCCGDPSVIKRACETMDRRNKSGEDKWTEAERAEKIEEAGITPCLLFNLIV